MNCLEKKKNIYWIMLKICARYNFYIETFFSAVRFYKAICFLPQFEDIPLIRLACAILDISFKLIQDEEEFYIRRWINISNYQFNKSQFLQTQICILSHFKYRLFSYSIDLLPDENNYMEIISNLCHIPKWNHHAVEKYLQNEINTLFYHSLIY